MSTKQESFPEHSPLGASGAERWMNCPGSNVLLNTLDLPESDESDYAAEGIAAHEAAAACLREDLEAWEVVGQTYHNTEVSAEMAEAVQVYLEKIRELRAEAGKPHTLLIEERISGDFSSKFYGTTDCGIVGEEYIDIIDYKHGQGIAVDAEGNPQLKYYAAGLLEKYMGPEKVRLWIIQPRAFHADGPIRMMETTTGEILGWRDDVLIPAMERAEIDATLLPGDWCRFCPAKLACPLLTGLFGVAAKSDLQPVPNWSDEALSANYKLISAVKMYITGVEKEVFARLQRGADLPDAKLVQKKANRVFKGGALEAAQGKFGDDAFNPPTLKSPPDMERISSAAKKFVQEWAYSPNTGLTVAAKTDRRPAVKVQSMKETFAHSENEDW